jgi:hypothetical protein
LPFQEQTPLLILRNAACSSGQGLATLSHLVLAGFISWGRCPFRGTRICFGCSSRFPFLVDCLVRSAEWTLPHSFLANLNRAGWERIWNLELLAFPTLKSLFPLEGTRDVMHMMLLLPLFFSVLGIFPCIYCLSLMFVLVHVGIREPFFYMFSLLQIYFTQFASYRRN